MTLEKSIFIIPLLIISLSCIAHSQSIYRWVDEQDNINFTTRYENIPLRYRDQVQKPEEVEEVEPIKAIPLKPEKPIEVEPTKKPEPKKEAVILPPIPLSSVTDNPNYVTFKGGIYSPQSDDLEDFDTGFNVEIALGHYFHPNFALELGIGYFETEETFIWFDPMVGTISEKDEIMAIPVRLTGKAAYAIEPVEVFTMMGVGAYFVNGEADISGAFGSFSFDDDAIVFGFHLGLGANFNITENIFLGIEGRYLWAEAEFEESVLGVPVELEADLDGYTVTGNIGFRF